MSLNDNDANQEEIELLSILTTQQQQLTELNATLTKLSRAQYKADTLMEAQQQKTLSLLIELTERLKQQETEQQAEQEELARRHHKELLELRAGLAMEYVPVLDGIETAIKQGQALIARQPDISCPDISTPDFDPQIPSRSAPPGFWQRLHYLFNPEDWPVIVVTAPAASIPLSVQWRAWLEGLTIIQERFLKLLAQSDIHQMGVVGEPFDPRRHVAIAAVTRAELVDGIVVEVSRKGYRQSERVLRYAEVTVNRSADK